MTSCKCVRTTGGVTEGASRSALLGIRGPRCVFRMGGCAAATFGRRSLQPLTTSHECRQVMRAHVIQLRRSVVAFGSCESSSSSSRDYVGFNVGSCREFIEEDPTESGHIHYASATLRTEFFVVDHRPASNGITSLSGVNAQFG
jgi:hypothetical protein